MSHIKNLMSTLYVDILFQNYNYRVDEKELVYFFSKEDLQREIIYYPINNTWHYTDCNLYSSGLEIIDKWFDSLEDLIKTLIIPYFHNIPNIHVKNIFTLWAKEWRFVVNETDEEIILKFERDHEYFYYPLYTKHRSKGYISYSYANIYSTTSFDIFDKSCWKEEKDCSTMTLFEYLLKDTYKRR